MKKSIASCLIASWLTAGVLHAWEKDHDVDDQLPNGKAVGAGLDEAGKPKDALQAKRQKPGRQSSSPFDRSKSKDLFERPPAGWLKNADSGSRDSKDLFEELTKQQSSKVELKSAQQQAEQLGALIDLKKKAAPSNELQSGEGKRKPLPGPKQNQRGTSDGAKQQPTDWASRHLKQHVSESASKRAKPSFGTTQGQEKTSSRREMTSHFSENRHPSSPGKGLSRDSRESAQ